VKKKVLVFLAIIYLPLVTLSQIGGDNTFEFLNLPNSARIAALGGNNISLYDKDLNMAYYNPALLRESMHNNLALNYTNYISDINYGYASYAYHFENIGTFAAGVYYMNYGDFIRANEQGEIPKYGEIIQRAQVWLSSWVSPTLIPVINASGVILHTNLGRAPLSSETLQAIQKIETATGKRLTPREIVTERLSSIAEKISLNFLNAMNNLDLICL